MECPFRAAFMRSIRSYHMRQRKGRVDAPARQSYSIAAASSASPCWSPQCWPPKLCTDTFWL